MVLGKRILNRPSVQVTAYMLAGFEVDVLTLKQNVDRKGCPFATVALSFSTKRATAVHSDLYLWT